MAPPAISLNRYRRARPPFTGDVVLLGRVNPAPPKTALRQIRSPAAQAGFPSPAADYIEEVIDLNDLLVRNPPSTFIVRVSSESLKDIGILPGDHAIVDCQVERVAGRVVVAIVDGDFYIKVLGMADGRPALLSRNEEKANEYRPIFLDTSHEHEIFGCVISTFRRFITEPAAGARGRQQLLL